ncbi:enoyl-CoA hydratase/isomerase family protein [Bartonella tamiae]|uniref:3-hydroxyisobutyryl-CoA hydrolase n=1 Tax=Bartonella tamiae Th239 TaxID=1094558 RepID=J0QSL5_9HYPH|nr:enoyl-CoA hydratase/isomerase family protein [Bartonella tamiae]EJF88861.1 hypothetical protein ME5_01412 [Bartonella tamiae Th239]EJF94889.1 hypothetical protein MEG_00470 [Bartonella tamiae Th307]
MINDFGGGQDIKFIKEGRAGIIQLTRPQALNALSHQMIQAMEKALRHWENDNDVDCVLIEGEGRAFCSGGDVVDAYIAGKKGQPAYEYFSDEYRLNAYIAKFPKPYIALLDGLCMGGGAGISLHGSHRIVTQNTLFAMPESAIGFFTDVGSGHFLPRLQGSYGIYLALTGGECHAGDCLQIGLGTHAVSHDNLDSLKKKIIKEGNPRPALELFSTEINFETSAETRALIHECFGVKTFDECLQILEKKRQEENEFAKTSLNMIKLRSPTSLKVIWRHLQECKSLMLNDCLKIENRIAHHMLDGHDFYEGVRAALIDKDKNPQWSPSDLSFINDEMVDTYFQPINNELVL